MQKSPDSVNEQLIKQSMTGNTLQSIRVKEGSPGQHHCGEKCHWKCGFIPYKPQKSVAKRTIFLNLHIINGNNLIAESKS